MPEINVPVTKIFMGKKPVNDSALDIEKILLEGGCWH